MVDADASLLPLRTRLVAAAGRPLVATLLLVVAIALVLLPWMLALVLNAPYVQWLVGIDADIYFDATTAWLADGTWYLPRQLAGPYGIEYGDVLYPPILLYLTVPFQVLPYALWWVIPIALAAAALWRISPPRWSWPLLVLCLAWPLSMEELIKGNPVLWILGAEAAAIAIGGPTTLVLIKVSLLPFALFGIRRRAWWLLLGLLGLLSLPLLGLTLQYPQVILDSRGGGLLYSVRDIPLLCIPVIAALAAGRLHVPRRAFRTPRGGDAATSGGRATR